MPLYFWYVFINAIVLFIHVLIFNMSNNEISSETYCFSWGPCVFSHLSVLYVPLLHFLSPLRPKGRPYCFCYSILCFVIFIHLLHVCLVHLTAIENSIVEIKQCIQPFFCEGPLSCFPFLTGNNPKTFFSIFPMHM